MLEAAKRGFRLVIAKKIAFPDREKHLSLAADCIANEICKQEEEGIEIDEGTFLALHYS